MFEHLLEDGEECKHFHHAVSPTGQRVNDYYVTNYGRVIRQCKTTTRVMALTPVHRYYYQVRLPHKTLHIHRLVGEHFLPDFSPELCVCHKDETLPKHLINRSDNLWMGTHKDNERDKVSKGRNHRGNQFVDCENAWMRLHTTDHLIIDVPFDARHEWLESNGMNYNALLQLRKPRRKHPYKGITHFEVLHNV